MADVSDHAAIVWHLEQTLAALMPDVDQYPESEVAAEIDRVAKKAELARLLGVFDQHECDAWVERAARVTEGRLPAAERRPYRARALAYLERLRDRARNSSPGPNTAEQQAALDGALLAYERAGLLTDSQARAWSSRLSIRKPRGLWLTEREKQANREFRGKGSPRLFAGPERRIGGTRIITVIIYDDGVVLAWQWDPTTAPRQQPDTILNRFYGRPGSPLDDAQLRNDRDQTYQRKGGYAQSTGYALRAVTFGQTMFAGRTSADVRRLFLTLGPNRLSIPIGHLPTTSILATKPVTHRGRTLVWVRTAGRPGRPNDVR